MNFLLKIFGALPAKLLSELALGALQIMLNRKDIAAVERAEFQARAAVLMVKAHEAMADVDARHRDLTLDELRGASGDQATGPVPPAPPAGGGPGR